MKLNRNKTKWNNEQDMYLLVGRAIKRSNPSTNYTTFWLRRRAKQITWVNNYFYTFFKRCWWSSRYETEIGRIKSFIGYQQVSKTRLSAPLLMKARIFKFLKLESKILRKAVSYRVKERLLDRVGVQRAREEKLRPVYSYMLRRRFNLPARVSRPDVGQFGEVLDGEVSALSSQRLLVEEPSTGAGNVQPDRSAILGESVEEYTTSTDSSDFETMLETSSYESDDEGSLTSSSSAEVTCSDTSGAEEVSCSEIQPKSEQGDEVTEVHTPQFQTWVEPTHLTVPALLLRSAFLRTNTNYKVSRLRAIRGFFKASRVRLKVTHRWESKPNAVPTKFRFAWVRSSLRTTGVRFRLKHWLRKKYMFFRYLRFVWKFRRTYQYQNFVKRFGGSRKSFRRVYFRSAFVNRLDTFLVKRFRIRALRYAKILILLGHVFINGIRVTNFTQNVKTLDFVELSPKARTWVKILKRKNARKRRGRVHSTRKFWGGVLRGPGARFCVVWSLKRALTLYGSYAPGRKRVKIPNRKHLTFLLASFKN